MNTTRPEILAPAGSYEAALAAFQYGADAIYLGLPRFSARADAQNVTLEQLKTLCAYAATFSPAKKIYITLNTLVHEEEKLDIAEMLLTLDEINPDGVIIQDLGLAAVIRRNFPRLQMHASTQLAAHNTEGVRMLKRLGFSRVVLARELTLKEIADIRRATGVEIEIFVHGALCYSISGLCLFSAMEFNRSGNRGRCAYCCRQVFDGAYPFSMRDLALAPIMDEVLASGADSLKIEGRMKSPLYVASVCDYYRRKRDGKLSPDEEFDAVQNLQTVFSRPWTQLYAQDRNRPPITIIDPVSIGHRGAEIGHSLQSSRKHVLRFKTNRPLEKFDGIQIDLPHGGRPYGFSIRELRRPGERHARINLAAGSEVEIPLPPDAPHIPAGSTVFCSSSQSVKRKLMVKNLRTSELPLGKKFDVEVTLSPAGATACANGVTVATEMELAPAKDHRQTYGALEKAFSRTGSDAWRLGSLSLNDPERLYFPASKANELRRQLLSAMDRSNSDARRSPDSLLLNFDETAVSADLPRIVCKFRIDQTPENFDFYNTDEIVLGITEFDFAAIEESLEKWTRLDKRIRLALPFWIRNDQLGSARSTIGKLLDSDYTAWETGDLSALGLLKELGVHEITADWTCYAFNSEALAQWRNLGVKRIVLSPELEIERQIRLSSMAPCECIAKQHVPLFFSVTAPCTHMPAAGKKLMSTRAKEYQTQKIGNLYVTSSINALSRNFPAGIPVRYDYSWS